MKSRQFKDSSMNPVDQLLLNAQLRDEIAKKEEALLRVRKTLINP